MSHILWAQMNCIKLNFMVELLIIEKSEEMQ